ncbi:MAG TPA: hypothetical protein VNN74_02450 [Candidatus Micrarchaeia archaeon]|nr:hypothetical protein [Candidatus Micrarchaeia archaeon]
MDRAMAVSSVHGARTSPLLDRAERDEVVGCPAAIGPGPGDQRHLGRPVPIVVGREDVIPMLGRPCILAAAAAAPPYPSRSRRNVRVRSQLCLAAPSS